MYRVGIALLMAFCATTAWAGCKAESATQGDKPNHRVHWTTRSEIQSEGFDVFRSESADGEFKKLNDKPIAAAKNSVRVREYEFKDYAIDPCKTYFYYVEAYSNTGYRMKLTAPQQAGPKAEATKPESK